MDRTHEDRSEDPTPRRLSQARRAGEIATSGDLGAGIVLFALCLAAAAGGKTWLGGLVAYLHTALGGAQGSCSMSAALSSAIRAGCVALVLPLGVLVGAAVLGGIIQTRGNFALLQLRPQGKRILPSLRRIFGRRRAGDVWTTWLKMIVLAAVAYHTLRPWLSVVANSARADGRGVLIQAGTLAQTLGLRLALAVLVLGVLDYFWQFWRYRQSLRMSHEELRREERESEGDPLRKAEQKRLHREIGDL